MLETICAKCRERYRPGTDHVCPKKPSGGSSAVERMPSKQTVEGSTPSPRSKNAGSKERAPVKGRAGSATRLRGHVATAPIRQAAQAGGKKSTAALMEVPRPPETHPSAGKQRAGRSVSDKRTLNPPLGTAGTQALPVDTKSKGGRPRIHPDRKAYRAQKAKEYRARDKAELAALRAEKAAKETK